MSTSNAPKLWPNKSSGWFSPNSTTPICAGGPTKPQEAGDSYIWTMPPHMYTADLTLLLLCQLGWTRLPHPPYSPDLVPCDFWLFPRLKKELRGVCFPTLQVLKDAVTEQILLIPSAEYKCCILVSWRRRWAWCQAQQGDYFEGIHWLCQRRTSFGHIDSLAVFAQCTDLLLLLFSCGTCSLFKDSSARKEWS